MVVTDPFPGQLMGLAIIRDVVFAQEEKTVVDRCGGFGGKSYAIGIFCEPEAFVVKTAWEWW
jgi:hypothetical protein